MTSDHICIYFRSFNYLILIETYKRENSTNVYLGCWGGWLTKKDQARELSTCTWLNDVHGNISKMPKMKILRRKLHRSIQELQGIMEKKKNKLKIFKRKIQQISQLPNSNSFSQGTHRKAILFLVDKKNVIHSIWQRKIWHWKSRTCFTRVISHF